MSSTLTSHSHGLRPKGRPCKASTSSPNSTRRKQVREAQRAYRSRQQSLLASLQERNSQLEDAMKQISQAMDTFRPVINAGPSMPPPRLLEAVRLLEDEICHQICHVLGPSKAHQECDPQKSSFRERLRRLPVRPCSQQLQDVSSTPPLSPQSNSQFWSCFLRSSHTLIPNTATVAEQETFKLSMTGFTEHSFNQPIPYTTTEFSRRLYRACAESGYRYLMDDSVTDQDMWPEFGLMLRSMSRSQIRSYFKRVLTVVPCNPVEDFQFPFISFGGAGTHFRGTDTEGQLPKHHDLAVFQRTNGIVEITSNEEWFDVHDVERFLVVRGVRLSRADPDCTPGISSSALAATTSVQYLQASQQSQSLSQPLVMSISEKVLIEGLSRMCICIGCAAAFRRRDVENFIFQNIQWTPPTNHGSEKALEL